MWSGSKVGKSKYILLLVPLLWLPCFPLHFPSPMVHHTYFKERGLNEMAMCIFVGSPIASKALIFSFPRCVRTAYWLCSTYSGLTHSF